MLPEPQEDNGDESDDEQHKEADGDSDKGRSVQAEGFRGSHVDHHLLQLGCDQILHLKI